MSARRCFVWKAGVKRGRVQVFGNNGCSKGVAWRMETRLENGKVLTGTHAKTHTDQEGSSAGNCRS